MSTDPKPALRPYGGEVIAATAAIEKRPLLALQPDQQASLWRNAEETMRTDLAKNLLRFIEDHGAVSVEVMPVRVDLDVDGDPRRVGLVVSVRVMPYEDPYENLDRLLQADDPPGEPWVNVRLETRCGCESKTMRWPAHSLPRTFSLNLEPREAPTADDPLVFDAAVEVRTFILERRNEFGSYIYRES